MKRSIRKPMCWIAFWALSTILIHHEAHASDLLGISLKKLGVLTSVNKSGTVNDQLGGYMTGGSIHTRNAVSNVNLMNMQAPSLHMGCGGIDLFKGGFGYINSAQLESLMKNIGSSALTFGTMLGIKTISPQIGDILSQLESMARFLNAQNMNSCQLGASIASGLWPKNAASQDMACQARQMGDSKVSNFFTARYDCSQKDKAEGNKSEYKGLLGTEFNLVFHAMKKKNPNIRKEEMELLMSVSGTLISQPKDGSVHFIHKPSLLRQEKLLDVLIYGQKEDPLKLYQCDTQEQCLNPTVHTRPMNLDQSFLAQVKTKIQSIAEKFLMETKGSTEHLSAEERMLVETSSVPILKIISLETALKGHNISMSVEEYAELVTFDFLIGYLDSMLDEVYEALSTLEYSQMDGEPIRNFKEEVKYVKSYLLSQRQGAFEHMNTVLAIKQRLVHVEQMVKGAFLEYRETKE